MQNSGCRSPTGERREGLVNPIMVSFYHAFLHQAQYGNSEAHLSLQGISKTCLGKQLCQIRQILSDARVPQYIISYATTTDKQSKNSETKAILLLCVPWWNRKLNRHLYCMQKVEKKQKMQRCKRCKKCKREKVKGVKAAKGVTDAKDAKDVKVQKMQKCKGFKKN